MLQSSEEENKDEADCCRRTAAQVASCIMLRVRQLRDEARREYDYTDEEPARSDVWRRYREYEELCRLSPRQVARMIDGTKK